MALENTRAFGLGLGIAGLAVLALACRADVVVSAAGIAGNGTKPCSDAIQRLIDANPNREIFFPDGTYLLDKPICTPAHPRRSVSLRLSAYALFKAAPNWNHKNAMVRLGAIHPANDIATPGSWYWLRGGIIDGADRADGVAIEGGRETLVADLSMKHVRVGLRIACGANSGSSDSDVRNVNIVGNGAADSVGVVIDGYDNTLQNMRIARVVTGVRINSGGNVLRDIHPLYGGGWFSNEFYGRSVGFDVVGAENNWFDYCYSDQFATGFRLTRGGVFDKCFCYWFKSEPGMRHTGFDCRGRFTAEIRSPTVVFKNEKAVNALLKVAKQGGSGFIRDARCDVRKVNAPDDVHHAYVK